MLKVLWKYINYENVFFLREGYSHGSVSVNLIEEFDTYFAIRQHPKYQLYDENLEHLLKQVDTNLRKALARGGSLFGPSNPPSDRFIALYDSFIRSQSDYEKAYDEFENFVKVEVTEAWQKYQEFVDELKRRRIIHLLVWND